MPEVLSAAERADCLFFDGTFWSEEELRELGASEKRASDMAHLPIGGVGGSLAALSGVGAARRIYIHLNNTNPVLREDSAERAAVERAGWEVARDGMEIAFRCTSALSSPATSSPPGCAARASGATTTGTLSTC